MDLLSRLVRVFVYVAILSSIIFASVSMGSVKARLTVNSPSSSIPCSASQQAELSKVNTQAAVIQAQTSSAFKSEVAKFTIVKFSSAYEVVQWNSPVSCLPLNEVYTVVFSAYNSSGFAGYLHVSEIPSSLTVTGVALQADQARYDYCSSWPCNTPIWAGWEAWNNNSPGSPYPGNCFTQCNTIYHVEATFNQPTASYPPTGCNTSHGCDVAAWVGLADQESATDKNLVQVGTTAQCNGGSSCSPTNFGWYEFYPSPAVNCNGMVIHGGDPIAAQTSNEAWQPNGRNQYYQMSIYDSSTLYQCSTIYTQYANMTTPYWADYIVEWPQVSCSGGICNSLAKFGTVPFSSAQYYCGSGASCYPQHQNGLIGLYPGSYSVNTNFKVMINECGCQSGGVLDVDTGLVSTSNSFTEIWDSSYGT